MAGRLFGLGCGLVVGVLSQAAAQSEPPNGPASIRVDKTAERFTLGYNGRRLFSGDLRIIDAGKEHRLSELGVDWVPLDAPHRGRPTVRVEAKSQPSAHGAIEELIAIRLEDGEPGWRLSLRGTVSGTEEAFPAQFQRTPASRFQFVRNSVGLATNLLNDSVYDRKFDWALTGPSGTRVVPQAQSSSSTRFEFSVPDSGQGIHLAFRPRFYQKHKNVSEFRPWEYKVWPGPICGWCSWWAYFDTVTEKDVHDIGAIFADKLKDYGYDLIQIDDGYQAGSGGLPKDWLNTNTKFPSGLKALSDSISSRGLRPALWLNVHFGDESFVAAHRDWFIQDADGKPHKGPWIDYGLDGSVKAAIDTVVRPTYRGLHEQGWKYVKIDALRHLLYDSTYPSRPYFAKKGIAGEAAFIAYLKAAREELGRDTYVLACWGVLPEVVGIADGCRLGGDGFGPSALQQYTSWNNVVWRNDPDHCDLLPTDKKTGAVVRGEERIRPTLVSMAGAQLLLSDKPEVYRSDEAAIEAARRCGPVLFTRPGQLYDFDPSKTDNLVAGRRNDQGGAQSGPIDASQHGEVCPWWMLDIAKPFESWSVLTRMNWTQATFGSAVVSFGDLGLDSNKPYLVYEYWTGKFLGVCGGGFDAEPLAPMAVATYSIRPLQNHPQVVSTSRHLSQGGVDLRSVSWSGTTLAGTSAVVKGDPYTIVVYAPNPAGASAEVAGKSCDVSFDGNLGRLTFTPTRTGSVEWAMRFKESRNPGRRSDNGDRRRGVGSPRRR